MFQLYFFAWKISHPLFPFSYILVNIPQVNFETTLLCRKSIDGYGGGGGDKSGPSLQNFRNKNAIKPQETVLPFKFLQPLHTLRIKIWKKPLGPFPWIFKRCASIRKSIMISAFFLQFLLRLVHLCKHGRINTHIERIKASRSRNLECYRANTLLAIFKMVMQQKPVNVITDNVIIWLT